MRKLPKSLAKEITEKSYYKVVKGDELDRLIALQLIDAAYNHGNKRTVIFLQKDVDALIDGLIGPRTLATVAAIDKNDVVL